jgi:hypothetical protein
MGPLYLLTANYFYVCCLTTLSVSIVSAVDVCSMSVEHWKNYTDMTEAEYLEKNLSQQLSPNPTLTGLGLNPRHRGDRPLSNRLSRGAAANKFMYIYIYIHYQAVSF